MSIWTLLLFCSLTWAKAPKVPDTIDLPFQKYAADFVKISHGKVTMEDLKHTAIAFKSLKGYDHDERYTTTGMCYYSFSGPTHIEIDPQHWATADEAERWSLIVHELGHCVCNRSHTPTSTWFTDWLGSLGIKVVHIPKPFPDQCQKSIMYPYNLGPSGFNDDYCISAHREEYIEELFGSCQVVNWDAIYKPFPPKNR